MTDTTRVSGRSRAPNRVGLDVTAGRDRHQLDLEAELAEPAERLQDRLVFDGGGEDVLAIGVDDRAASSRAERCCCSPSRRS